MQEMETDTTIHDSMDLEMQLLPSPPADDNGGRSTREIIHRVILLVQSSLIFIAGRNHGDVDEADADSGFPPVSRTSSTNSNHGNPDVDGEIARSERMDLEKQLQSSPSVENNSGSSAREKWHRLILVVRSTLIFNAGKNQGYGEAGPPPVSRASSSKSIDVYQETERIESMEEAGGEVVHEAQTAPLLVEQVDNTQSSGKLILKTLMHALFSCQIFKARAASPCIHLGSSDATQRKPEVEEDGDSLVVSFENCVYIDQTVRNEMTVNQVLQRSQSQNISKIVREKHLPVFRDFGGLRAVEDALNTDRHVGISDNEATYRSGLQAFSQSPTSTFRFCQLSLKALKSKTILLLSLGAVLSIGFGIKEDGPESGWFDGLLVLVTIIVLVLFNLIRNWWQERRARKKLENQHFTKNEVGEVHVIRGGEAKCICKSMLVCGDIVLLKKGFQVPADGLFAAGEALELDDGSDQSCIVDDKNPFLSYGDRVINGDAQMIVTSMDMNSGWSEMMSKASSDPHTNFKLEAHLDKLTACTHHTGLVISILIIVVLFLRYMIGKMDQENGYRIESKPEPAAMRNYANSFRKIVRESKYITRAMTKLLSVSLVGVMEGVPFVVSVAIFHTNNNTLSGKATEQDSHAVIKTASVTRICTDAFGDFTEDEMEVDKIFIGREVISGCSTIPWVVMEALGDGINASTEKPFLRWGKNKLGSERKRMMQSWKSLDRRGNNPFEEPCSVLMRGTGESAEMFLHMNGPVMEVLKRCTHYYDDKGHMAPMDDQMTRFLYQANNDMQHKQLRTIAFARKRTNTQTPDMNNLELVALLGLKNKSWEDTRTAVEACRESGIETVMVSSKKLSLVHNIALRSGLITNGDSEALVVTGEAFRRFSDKTRFKEIDKIRVLGEALPSDKSLFVKLLRKKGQVVAFLGQRTDEAPALKGADIGIAVGTWSSQKARESSEIILWDGSFVDLIGFINSGKCMYYNIQQFVQLSLSMTVSSTLINFFGTVAFGDAPLTTIELVWVNLLVVFVGGFALLTKPSTASMVPVKTCGSSLITMDMTRNIVAQVLYQTIVLMILQAKGSSRTMIFNSFIMCQFFNQFNAREVKKKNYFRSIHRHKEFWVAVAIFIVLQAIFVAGEDILGYGTRLNWKQWAGCVFAGSGSWLFDWLVKSIPDFIKMLL